MGSRHGTWWIVGLLVLIASSGGAQGADAAGPFPFAIPVDSGLSSTVSADRLIPAPLDERSRIRVRDGHFVTADNRRVRFLGINLVGGSCFPPKEVATGMAARLRALGINAVRLHHMDAAWARPNLFSLQGGQPGASDPILAPESMERLDWLVAQLAANGIYVDLNLHVSRGVSAADGLPDHERLDGQGKVVGYFEPRLVARQVAFARELLDHRNPYTGMRWAVDPAVALVELTNEHSLLGSAAAIPALPQHYRDELSRQWSAWLEKRYRDSSTLRARWNADAKPLGASLLANARFEDGEKGWVFERHGKATYATGTGSVVGATNAPPGRALHLSGFQIDGTGWHLQLHQVGLDLVEGETYTVEFAARAASERTVGVNVRHDVDPWTNVGLDRSVRLTPDWQRFTMTFTSRGVRPQHSRLSFTIGNDTADWWLADVSLRSGGGGVAVEDGALERGMVPLAELLPSASGHDWAEFLMAVEDRYVDELTKAIRDAGCRAPITCSQASYGGIGGVRREARTDWVDMHAYWQHPYFPGRAWDGENWRIGNQAMVRDRGRGTFDGLAMHRVAGKPFTVSEYDHAAPSEYAAEGIPLIAAYAAWQDWDGIFLFAYAHGAEGCTADRITGYFDHAGHAAKLAMLPSAARILIGGALAPSPAAHTLTLPLDTVMRQAATRTDYGFWDLAGEAMRRERFLTHRSAVRLTEEGEVAITADADPATSALRWLREPGRERVLVDAPTAKLAVGFLAGGVELGGFRVAAEPGARGFAAITLVSLDGEPVGRSRRLLLTAVDKAENPGLAWNAERTFAPKAWSTGPVEVTGVSAAIVVPVPAAARVRVLGAGGSPLDDVPAQTAQGSVSFRIEPSQRTVWWLIEAE